MTNTAKFLRAKRELAALREGQQALPRDKWYKVWGRWRAVLSETREYRLFRAEVIVRAKGSCERCDEDGEHVHHIIPVYKDLDLCVDKQNGELLCAECHSKEHDGKLTIKARKR